MRRLWVTTALAGAAFTAPAAAETIASGPAVADEVVVTATRTEKDPLDAPATVSVTTAREIEDQLATDIKDLVRFEPGVSVRSSPARFGAAFGSTGRDGNAGFNIRGLEGNRVLIQIDGVRLPDAFSFGAQNAGRGDFADLDLLKSVEILRGPASALYGSDGVAGAVSFTTKDPEDLFREGRDVAARGRLAYASADESLATGLAFAGRRGAWSGLLAWTGRDGGEQATQGTNEAPDASRTVANPQDVASDSWLGKLVWRPTEAHRFRLTLDRIDREVATEVLSGRAIAPPPPAVLPATAVIDLDALDTTERTRIALDHRWDGGEGALLDRAQWTVFRQDSATVEFSDEDRNTAADRTRRNTFENRVWGVNAQAERTLNAFGVEHRLVFGGDWSITRQEGVRDGTVPPTGEAFPTRAFPNTDYRLAGLFVQDEIALFDGRLSLFPALRFDWYELEPEADPLLVGTTESSRGRRLSPKFGAVFWATPRVGFFANYGEGFKAPSPSQVNSGFSNLIFGYVSIPAPDLEPETSRTIEGGVRFKDVSLLGANWRASATAFRGEYENFIEQIALSPPLPAACGAFPLCFQFVNLGEVELSGFEARADGAWDNGLGVIAALSYTRGDQTSGGAKTPLDSVDPLKLVAGLTYAEPQGRFGGRLIATWSDAKARDRIGGGCSPSFTPAACFATDSFFLLDATAFWNVTENATLRAGVFNLTDETYAWWSDVRGLSRTSPVADAYTQPGRNVGLSLTLRY
jgi:hemoglobin/transferrin/lactoferrin receptor protein